MHNDILKVGIAGLGTVGTEVIRIIKEKSKYLKTKCGKEIKIVGISAKDINKYRSINLKSFKWYSNPIELAKSIDIDVFVELIGGTEIAYKAVNSALISGHHVVTANKELLAKHGMTLAQLAENNKLLLNFEASVAGGIPIIKILRESLICNNVSKIYGILNGTCNYILTRMQEKELSFQECLLEAQNLGYAESNPDFDICGQDTAHKLTILSSIVFRKNINLEDITIDGIKDISLEDVYAAKSLGYCIKLIGIAKYKNNQIDQRVQLMMIPNSSIISNINGITNIVVVETDLLGKLVISGYGAGGSATASSVVGDIIDIANLKYNNNQKPIFGFPVKKLKKLDQYKNYYKDGCLIKIIIKNNMNEKNIIYDINQIMKKYKIYLN